jgi:D-alanyl-D-alanine carboxypeptidase
MVATAADVARFYAALLRGRLVSAPLLREMERTTSMGAPGEAYGFGLWATRSLAVLPPATISCGPVWGHNGEVPGYYTLAFSTKDASRQVVVLANGDLSRLGPPGKRALLRIVDVALCR